MKRILLCLAAFGVVLAEAQQKQVWDFGCEVLDTEQYENMLSEAEVNSWYGTEIAPGTSGVNLPAFTASDSVNLRYNTNGASNHRLRTLNTNVTRYDEKSQKDAAGNVYRGYIYSNSGKQPLVYVEQRYEAGDMIEFYVGSNGGKEVYRLESPGGNTKTEEYTASAKIEKLTFYIGEDGLHRFCGVDEKLVLARIVRTPATKGVVSGTITAPGTLPTNYGICLTNIQTNGTYSATITGNTYRAEVPLGYEYEIGLTNANGFIISNGTTLQIAEDGQRKDIQIEEVETCAVSGSIAGLPTEVLERLSIEAVVPEGKVFQPIFTINHSEGIYSAEIEKSVSYTLVATGVNDYGLTTTILQSATDTILNLAFEKKALWDIAIEITLSEENGQQTTLTQEATKDIIFEFSNLNEEGYIYTFTGTEGISLRDGTYSVVCKNLPQAMRQMLTSNLRVAGKDTSKQIDFESNVPLTRIPYRSTLYVGQGQEFKTINMALKEARRMERSNNEPIEIMIDPGNYEEMLLIDIPNITLKNASATPSIGLKNAGVDIDENAVRITGYYGWGYNYYSMGGDGFYDERILQVNKENGYVSTVNPAQGNTLWNATVVVSAKDFKAENIIFENSFNQYISQREAKDIVEETASGKGLRPTEAGNTDVQDRKYRERACALGFKKTADRAWLVGCRVISRQDALYGDEGCRVAIEGGILNGSCDYIFGGMTLIARGTRLDMLVSSDPNDIAYLTASKTSKEGRGYLLYECSVGSATPLIDMAEELSAQPGYFGRPWDVNGETVFFNTHIAKSRTGVSMIVPAGWNNGLVSSGSARSYEYGSIEESGVDNTSKRATWATVLQTPVLPDGTKISLYNFTKGNDGWNPFNDDNTSFNQATDQPFIVNYTQDGLLQISQVCEDTLVQLYNLQGMQIVSSWLHSGDEYIWTIPAGMYILSASKQDMQYTQKIRL